MMWRIVIGLCVIGISLFLYRYYSSYEAFQTVVTAPTPTCVEGYTIDETGSCVGYACEGGPDKMKNDGTNNCLLSNGKTIPAIITKYPMTCPKGYIGMMIEKKPSCIKY